MYVLLWDDFHSHRKVLAAGLEATGLHVRAMSYSAATMSSGHVPNSIDVMLAGTRASLLRGRLLAAGLRDRCDAHPQCTVVHDWAGEQ